ncbi:long-chain fatty acid--CoA ligase [Acetobacter sp. DsW_063]|uniref:long-chain-fatty-acid--CoA ligase n=1 Tax=Acetobacter sp. DsW_063 TaxID=1514894 RepID=UPI0018E94306|nr:long-chain fatty acid--CoA ligase [Acetobacter sp. DsW_063]
MEAVLELDREVRSKAMAGMSDGSLFDMLDATVKRSPNVVAIDFMGKTCTYRELLDAAESAATGLYALGVRKGDRVGLCLPNTPYSVKLFFAIQRLGAIAVNINPLYVEHEIKQVLGTSGVKVLVVTDLALVAKSAIAAAKASNVERIVVCPFADVLPWMKSVLFRALKSKELLHLAADKRLIRYSELIADKHRAPFVKIEAERDVAVFQFTGGTTGVPKAAMLTHANLLSNLKQIDHHIAATVTGQQVILGVLPLFHVFALMTVMLLGVERGATMVLLPRFDAKTTLDTLLRTKTTLLPAVPTILTALLREKEVNKESFSKIVAVISGGAPLPSALRRQFEEMANCPVIEGYGLSETSPVLTFNPLNAVRDGSCGTAVQGTEIEIRDIDPPHERLPLGQPGEVCVRGPQVMLGYWGVDNSRENPFTEDGFFKTGDVGYLDRDGYLFLVDRLKDIILCGGYNVYPHVIEEALYRHPAVLETIVLGVPDSYRGQAPKAFVTVREGFTVTEKELLDHVSQYVSKIERPREIAFRDSLPKTLIGKLSKKDLIIQENLQTQQSQVAARKAS